MHTFLGRFFLLIFVASAAAWSTHAQTTQTPLTNGDIAAMVKAGVPEDTIILAIRAAAANGTASFDTNSAALVQLKNAGASTRVLGAIIDTPVNPVPDLPTESGVYYRATSGWQKLPMNELWSPYYSKSLSIQNYDVKMPVPKPEVHIPNAIPSFYVRAFPAPTEWMLALLDEKHELRAKVDNQMLPTLHFSPEQQQPVSVAPVTAEVLTVKPKVVLPPGDYALCAVVPGSRDFLTCYPFRVGQ